MRSHRFTSAGALLLALALGGCKEVGPNYKAPAMPAPPAYSDGGRNGNWSAAVPADATNHGDWWTVYQDAELNRLEQLCATANQNIAAALHAYEQAHDLVRENKASLYPTVSIGASATRNRISETQPLHTPGAQTNYWAFLIPVTVSWEPDFWGGIRRQIESSAASAQASAADLANTRLSLQGMLAVIYLQVRGIDLQAKLLRSTLDSYEQTLKLTQERMKGGLASQSDVEEAETQLEQTRAQLINLGVQRAQSEHAIAVLVGEPATGFHVTEKPLAGDVPSIPTGIPSELLQRRPDIAGAERRVAAANALIGVAKSAYYPNITLSAGGGLESDLISKVFNAGDVEDQLAALRVLEEESAVTGRAVASAKRSTELATMRYKRGLSTYLEVLTDQTIELGNEREAASLVAERIVASAQLQIALGGGWNSVQLPAN
jgi:NodT family efflux transporter outer membrane factor (OMF) lipoprotein